MDEEEKKPKKKRKEGEPKEHKPNWRETYATKAEIKQMLADHVYLRYNTVKHREEYRLPPWDGLSHILALSATVTVRGGTDMQMRFYEYLRKWLVAMVASWVDEDEINQTVLVLIGEQGSYKTTWFANLLPPELRYPPYRSHGRRGYRVVAYSGSEIESNRRVLADDARLESEGGGGDTIS